LHTGFPEETLVVVWSGGQRWQGQLLDHFLMWNIDRADVGHGAEGRNHAEQRNSQHSGAGPERPGSFGSVVKELR